MDWSAGGLMIRSGLLLLTAAVLRRIPNGMTPAYRHRILLSGFLLLLSWPAINLLLPEVYVPLAFAAQPRETVTVQQLGAIARTGTGLHGHLEIAVAIWAAGAVLLLALLFVSHLRAYLLRRKAELLDDPDWSCALTHLADRLNLPSPPSLYVVRGNVMPQTLGLLRASILLPQDCLSWSAQTRQSVLLHELAHIRRCDLLWQLVAAATTALWWFQPLCWILQRALRAESEAACDAEVLACGVRASAYASDLLALAQRYRVGHGAAALPMANGGLLERRLHTILAGTTWKATGPQWKAIWVLIAAATLCSTISFAGDGRLPFKGGVSMRRTLFAGLLTSAGLSAASIAGSVVDPSGAAVLNAKASIYNPDTKDKQETLSMADGKFVFSDLPAGQYILRVEKQGFAPLLREFSVQQNTSIDRGLVLRDDMASEDRPDGRGAADARDRKVIRVGGQVAQSNLVTKVVPVYPASAKSAGTQGQVLLEAIISADGLPEDLRVLSSPADDLSQSALEAVRQWRYRPTLLNGNPVEVLTTISVNYTLAP